MSRRKAFGEFTNQPRFGETLIMPFGIGYLELATTLICTSSVLVSYIIRMPQRSWSVVVLGCVTLASVLTPADLFSMLLMAIAFFAVYVVGSRHPFSASSSVAATAIEIGDSKN